MADTIRTLADLQTLLADNTTGDASPQDVRDFLVSCFPYSLEIPAPAFYAVVGSPALGQTGGLRGSAWHMDAAAEEAVAVTIPLPVGWRRTGTFKVTVYFSMASATSGDVVVRVMGDAYADGANLAAAAVDQSVTVTVPGTAEFLKLQEFSSAITIGATDRMLQIRVGRVGDDGADDATGDLYFHGVSLAVT